jgi:SNF2 family DNA or RNA helicase
MGTPTVAECGIISTPYQHQWDCFSLSKDREAFAIFSDLGTGKCLMCLMTAGHLYNTGKIKRLLVVAPRGCYRVWPDEVEKHLGIATKVAVWSSYQTSEVRKQLADLEKGGEALRILVVNVEACNSERAIDAMVDFMKAQHTMLIVDESTTLKNPQAKRTKIMINVGKYAKYRRICSGNPMPNGPLDLWSQGEFLKKNLMGFGNYFAFRNRFAVMQDQRFGNRAFKHVVGYRDLEVLKAMMNKFAFVVKKEDCLDLPPKIYQVVDISMGPKQTEYYNKMVQDAYIQLSATEQVTAPMVMTQLVKLHQITCGFVSPDGMDPLPIGEKLDRIEEMLDRLEQAPGKAIVWATYRYNIKQIVSAIAEKFGADSVAHFYGDTPMGDPDDPKPGTRIWTTGAFQDPMSRLRFIVANPASGRFGNTWTQGTTVIYYSNDYNLESRSQSEDRSHRIGQNESVTYIDLVCRGTVDEKILKILKAKKKLTDEIVQSNWRWLIGGTVEN